MAGWQCAHCGNTPHGRVAVSTLMLPVQGGFVNSGQGCICPCIDHSNRPPWQSGKEHIGAAWQSGSEHTVTSTVATPTLGRVAVTTLVLPAQGGLGVLLHSGQRPVS
ncbi:hypothetical protein DUNSADRAFT_2571, partial [Dunaliella salina]